MTVLSGEKKKVVLSAVSEFRRLLQTSGETLKEACQLYTNIVTEIPEARALFAEAFPRLDKPVWDRFEQVGRGLLHHELLIGNTEKIYLLKNLPIHEQDEALHKGVKVIASDGTHLKLTVDKMTYDQKEVVFAKDHIRSLPEQKAYVETKAMKMQIESRRRREQESQDDYHIVRNNGRRMVEFLKPRSYTASELLAILTEMQK